MAKEKKDKKKSGIVIVVGTGGPKSPTKTADPCMKKAWAFLKNLPPLPRDDDGESKAPTEEELAAMIGAIERAEPKGPTEEEDDLARQDFARHIGLRPPKLSAEQEYQKERNRVELGLGDDAPSGLPPKRENKGIPGIIRSQPRKLEPSGQLDARENISLGPPNRGPAARPESWEGGPYGPSAE